MEVAIVANPVFASPPAIYAVMTRKASGPLDVQLYAIAPAPQSVEFPDPSDDLAKGMVSRRGLFLWNFVRTRDSRHVALIKVDPPSSPGSRSARIGHAMCGRYTEICRHNQASLISRPLTSLDRGHKSRSCINFAAPKSLIPEVNASALDIIHHRGNRDSAI